eukprot:1505338-Prymnesium_polylepis.3
MTVDVALAGADGVNVLSGIVRDVSASPTSINICGAAHTSMSSSSRAKSLGSSTCRLCQGVPKQLEDGPSPPCRGDDASSRAEDGAG